MKPAPVGALVIMLLASLAPVTASEGPPEPLQPLESLDTLGHPSSSLMGVLGALGLPTEASGGQDDPDDQERQSVLWRALPKRVAPPPGPAASNSLRQILGRLRTSGPRKSAQFTPTGVLAEGEGAEGAAYGGMISDPGPAADPEGLPRYPSSGVTREIQVRQGRLVGVVRTVPRLGEVHQFLGLPYAEPPVGSQRFMPPASPSQWKGLKVADRFGPVCPQVLPDLSLHNVSAGRLSQVQRLLPYLQDQSEDCLYLNVYAPSQASSRSSRLPVIVYIHGESLEWNAGTPYDGSVLAVYGKVIVVTFNFRLGMLGFLRPGVHDTSVSNFGLLDQVAALQWVKDNIEALGGDPHAVTLMGHSTGAACAALLLVSPVSSNLFKRAILMSGTALADWAITASPLKYTIQVAGELNCQLNDDLAACLRKKRLSDLLAVKVSRDPFKTPFGPVVDGSVIPNEPLQLMGTYRELFSRYELLLGVTEQEAYHLLDGKSLAYGVLERDRDELLKHYTYARFEKHPDVALARTLAEYAQDAALRHPVAAEGQRDLLLDILSDARVTAPVVRTAELHAEANRSSFLYVFTHRTRASNYPAVDKSVQGDELDYVFGLPLAPSHVGSGRHFTQDEKRLSEQVITLWTNFARKGNPNIPRRHALYWPEFDPNDMGYLNISIPTSVNYRYRAQQMKYWNHDLPEFLVNPQLPQLAPWSEESEESNAWGVQRMYQPGHAQEEAAAPRQVFGTLVRGGGSLAQGQGQGDTPHQRPHLNLGSPRAELDISVDDVDEEGTAPRSHAAGVVAPSTLALSVVIVVGVSFLLVNVCAFGFLYYKKNRLRVQQQFFSSQCRGGGLEEDGDDAYMKKAPSTTDGGFTCNPQPQSASQPPQPPPLPPVSFSHRIRRLLSRAGAAGGGSGRRGRPTRGPGVGAPSGTSPSGQRARAESRDDLYEAVRSASRSTSRTGRPWRTNGPSSSRDDGPDVHAKVREWVAQEVVQRCSPGFLRRGRRPSGRTASTATSLDQLDQPSTSSQRPARGNVQKVSVAIDATPGARSSSVLRQLPIEFSKSLDEAGTRSADPELPPATSDNAQVGAVGSELRRSSTSIHLQPLQPSVVDIVLAPSSPVLRQPAPPATHMQTFAAPAAVEQRDVNVTSRDEEPSATSALPEEALDNIRRRNFPKVLPDFPGSRGLRSEDGADCADGLASQQLSAMQLAAARRRSLPPGQLQLLRACGAGDVLDSQIYGRMRPAPPPRSTSTLGRRQQVGARVLLPATLEQPGAVDGGHGGHGGQPEVRYEPRVIIKARDPLGPGPDEPAASDTSDPGAPATVTSSSSLTLRRPEPRVIIKATSTMPVRPTNCSDYGTTQAPLPHPQVHMQPACPPAAPVAVEPLPTAIPSASATPTTPATVTFAPAALMSPGASTTSSTLPTIAPKPALKKPAPPVEKADKVEDVALPDGEQRVDVADSSQTEETKEPPKSPKAAAKTPPTPPPLPKTPQKQRKGGNQKEGGVEAGQSQSVGNKTGTMKKGKRK